MKVVVNGETHEIPEGSSVADVVVVSGAQAGQRGVAVAVGGEVIPRGEWEDRRLGEGESIEVVHAVQGG